MPVFWRATYGGRRKINASETVVSTPYLAVAIPTTGWLLQCVLGKSGKNLLLKLNEFQFHCVT